jgi:hypothetical protein
VAVRARVRLAFRRACPESADLAAGPRILSVRTPYGRTSALAPAVSRGNGERSAYRPRTRRGADSEAGARHITKSVINVKMKSPNMP